MGRPLRCDRAGFVYHVLNRANGRATLFRKDGDFEAFERVLIEAQERTAIDVLAYCILPNHWHLVLQPRRNGDLSRYVGWLTLTHTQRWHAHHHNTGGGHLYQGRFKSFPVENGAYFLTLCRYVERNGRRAGLVRRAEAWRWCSLVCSGERPAMPRRGPFWQPGPCRRIGPLGSISRRMRRSWRACVAA